MNLPIQLPSGNWVDQSTVLKWRSESKIWSRGLTDPFTGQLINYELIVDTTRRSQIVNHIHGT